LFIIFCRTISGKVIFSLCNISRIRSTADKSPLDSLVFILFSNVEEQDIYQNISFSLVLRELLLHNVATKQK
jgi:hypothetical protein